MVTASGCGLQCACVLSLFSDIVCVVFVVLVSFVVAL